MRMFGDGPDVIGWLKAELRPIIDEELTRKRRGKMTDSVEEAAIRESGVLKAPSRINTSEQIDELQKQVTKLGPPPNDPITHYAAEAAKPADSSDGPTSSSGTFLLAQQRFIAAQTYFIHNQQDLRVMFTAQMDFIIELCYYISTHKIADALTLQERMIVDMQELIQQKKMI